MLGTFEPTRRLTEALAGGGLEALLGPIEVPVRVADKLALPAVRTRRVSIAAAELPVEAQVSSLAAFGGKLWVGIRSGLRYVRHSLPLRALIIRNLAFSFCASALWALLPVVSRDQLGLGAGGFGMLVGFFGAGAVVGALWIPRHLQKMSLNTVVTWGYLLWIVAASIISTAPMVALAIVGTTAAGVIRCA